MKRDRYRAVITCMHENHIDSCPKCPKPLSEIEIEEHLFNRMFNQFHGFTYDKEDGQQCTSGST